MEPANFHHYHQQDDHVPVDSSSFPIPSCYGLSWSQNPLLTCTNSSINSRNLAPCGIDSMAQDLGFPWSSSTNNNGMGYPIDNFMTHELQRLARIKDEFSVSESYPKFLDMLNCSPTSSIEDLQLHPPSSYVKNNNDHHQQIIYSNNNQDFLLTTLSSVGCQIKGGQFINDQNCSNGLFNQIFPTISVSSLNQSSSTSSSSSSGISSSSFDMNSLPALDLFGSPRFDGSFTHPASSLNAHNLGGLSYGLNSMHQPINHRPSVCPSKIPSVSTNRNTDQPAKRPASKYIDAKATQSVSVKKSKVEPRPSSAPFQVRKEKLGDRIAAIQQLVAPFGKTDTASVLMEAIGYIKFLQTQVETLSVPYMKSIDKTSGIPTRGGHVEEGNKETKKDLRSRGLCLVPLPCLSYITGGGSEGIWPGP
ncbi:hypothetical protein L6452_06740 [Arctium lappa]|uniref:Uncharacterized protein n=1 Tax=Arctium lappa TaxID=4217 RepID=A0ACB9EJD0_ARCLA|nr:hypothetical protein L6452_06740 [Arctium lappa]